MKALQQLKNVLRSSYTIVIIETLLLTLFTLGTFSLLLRLTDAKTIGLWVLINSLLSFSRIADFWSAGLSSFVAQSLAEKKQQTAISLVSTAVISTAIGYFALIIIVTPSLYIFASHIPGVQDVVELRRILPLMSFTFWLLSMATTYQIGFLGFNRAGLKVMQTVSGAVIFLVGSLLLVPRYGLWGILLAQTAQGACMLVYAVGVFHLKLAGGLASLRWSRRDFSTLANYGSKFGVISIMQVATDPIARLLVSQFGGLESVTIVEVANRIILAARGLIISAGQVLVPEFARGSAQDVSVTVKLYRLTRQIFVQGTIVGFALLLCLAPLFETVMLGKPTALFIPIFWVLCWGWGINTAAAPAFFLLTGHRRLRPLFWNRLLHLAATLVLGAIGGWWQGTLGVCYGVALGLALSALLILKAAEAFEHVTAERPDIYKILRWSTPLVAAVIGSAVAQNSSIPLIASLLSCIVVIALAFWALPLMSTMNNLLHRQEIRPHR